MHRLAGIAICFLAGAASAQTDSGLTARQIFDYGVKPQPVGKNENKQKTPPVVKPPVDNPRPPGGPPVVSDPAGGMRVQPAAYAPLALRYSILQKQGDVFKEVDPESEFHSEDRIRVKVEANGTAYLYIVLIGSSGQSRVLFPDKDIDGGNNHVTAGQPFFVPSAKDSFYFDKTAGVERVSLILTRAPEPDLEKLIYEVGDPTRTNDQHKTIMAQNNIDDAVLGSVREKLLSRDLVFEKYDGPAADGKQEKAMYAATKDKSPDARLFVDLQLTHK